MPRRSSDGIPGSVYAKGGYLYLTVNGRTRALGLPDTRSNRRVAQGIKRDEYLRSLVPEVVSSESYAQAWDRFVREHPRLSERTVRDYHAAFLRVITTPERMVSAEGVIAAVAGFDATTRKYGASRPMADTAVNSYLRQFRVWARWAETTYGLRPLNLQRFMRRVAEQEVKTFTTAEVRAIVAEAPEQYQPLIRFMALTGARPSDAMRLGREALIPRGIRWLNKITKLPEPRPVSTVAWELAARHIPFPPYTRLRSFAMSFDRAMVRADVVPDGRGLQELRTTFKARIDGLPWQWQVWLMRHHTGGVTERHYQSFDWVEVVRVLDGLEAL